MPFALKSAPYKESVYGTQKKSFYSKSQIFLYSVTYFCLSLRQANFWYGFKPGSTVTHQCWCKWRRRGEISFWKELQGFRFLWLCIMNIRWREKTNKMQLIRCLLSNFLSQHVSGITMPIIRRIRLCPTACGVLPGCVGCGLVELRRELCACESNSNFHTVHTAHDAAPQDHSQPQPTHPGRTQHAAGHSLILLMMGMMMPETCWDRKFDNKHRISCILLVLSLHLSWRVCVRKV